MSEAKEYLKTADEIVSVWGESYRNLADLLDEPGVKFTADRQIEVSLPEPVRTDEGEETTLVIFKKPCGRHMKYAGRQHPNPIAMQFALVEVVAGLNAASLDELDLKCSMRLMRVAESFL